MSSITVRVQLSSYIKCVYPGSLINTLIKFNFRNRNKQNHKKEPIKAYHYTVIKAGKLPRSKVKFDYRLQTYGIE